ncbi:Ubiquinone/menaquinone biosynthesis C-methylase UbiE [Acetitomaculum ruminis DSM 5522]|uniref:Ubiquinone/menaquinone biosynthesis C-methylase UbiE n=1 Tax=Acetitomaculum ruminis DSM 5522 TaxID=1120918 RepID=A0A1I1A9P1_9FIRM|nr:class I SAM-dependent methyltransferase [Acetitomaculum ruminis]SFB34701.1 Ubiquinone/menaquinone biosynthesis C-methylase UbiE [Acetitomaculum ruminis DSM 5522]
METTMDIQDQINDYWTKGAENYSRIIKDELNSFRVEKWQNRILKNAPKNGKLDILDTGCGPGFFTMILSDLGHNVTGIDGSDGMINEAMANIRERGNEATILKMDCNNLEFLDESFDMVISRNLTHTLQDHVKVYSEWKRVLKKGGILLIFDANWHLTQIKGKLRDQYIEDIKSCIEIYGEDFSGNTDVEEAIKVGEEESRVLGDIIRPDWDLGILKALGYKNVSCERDITKEMWDDKERLIYSTTPMFQIKAEK